MPRYEFQEGSSNKFWEITLEGTSFVTRYGKIGTAGQETRKDWPSADKAKVEYEKLIAEKVKKGYQLVGGAPAPKAAKPEPAPKAAKPEPAPKAAKPEPAPKAAKPAKPEPAKPEPAKGPAAPASAKGGALRYELVEGSSSKFWEIELQGDQFVTRYGKIGTNGQSTTKSFGDVATAKIEHDKLVAEKERKGYALVAGEKAGPPPEARNAELEAAILDRPDDDEAWAVYADWLLAQGDPRGELIALSLAGKKQEADKVFAANGSALVPGPARKRRRSEDDDDEGGSAWPLVQKGMTWERGFLRSLRVKPSYDDWESGCDAEHVGSALAEVFAHSSSRFLRELTLGLLDFESDPSYPVVLEAIVKERPPLRSLFLGDFEYPDDTEMSWGHIGDLSKLWQALPRLQRLVLQGGGELTLGAIDAPDLRHFELRTGGLPKSELASITSARWPALETLSLWLGSSSYGWDGSLADLEPILAAEGLPALRHLGLKNAELTDELAKRLPDAKITKQLRTLDLSMGTLSDEGAKALAAGAAKLAHLERIDVADNIVATKALLAPLGAKVHFGKQRKIEDWWEDRRYVSVGE